MTYRTFVALVAGLLSAAPALAQPPASSGQPIAPATPYPGVDPRPPNSAGQKPAFAGQTRAPEHKLNVAFDVVTVANVANPWGLAFLPDGRLLVTERTGALRIVATDGTVSPPVAGLPAVDPRAQGGLLDVALDPEYRANRLIYWSYAEPHDDKTNNTAVARGVLVDGAQPRVDNVQVIYRQVPAMPNTPLHYGSRLVFGRDGTLFVTQGDRSITEGRMQSQQMDSLLGKIVRIHRDGSIPKDNPFVGKDGVRPEIWSFGHRNVEAATLHPVTGELWAVEMGTRGGDELNIARRGGDYGWPTIAYGIEYQGGPITGGIQVKEGMEQPRYYWDPVIAPSGMVFYTSDQFPAWKGSLFVGGLGARALVRLTLDGDTVVGEERLLKDLQPRAARIRDVRQGLDGAIYILAEGGTGPAFGPPSAQPQTTPPGSILKLVPKASGVSGLAQPARSVEQPKVARQVFSFAAKRREAKTEVALSNHDTEGRFTLQDEIWAPDFSVPPHFHAKHSEVFYVVSGQVEWTVNGETHVIGPGDTVFIPPNTPHAVKTVGGKEAHMLMLYEPGGYEDDALRESLFSAEQRKDPKIADALSRLGDFHPTTMPARAPTPK